MKKAVCGIIAAFFVLIAVSAVKAPEKSKEVTVQNVVSVENSAENSALDARFLNMLNHNYIYDSQFDDVEEIINGSTPALLNLREDEYIAEHHVIDYVYNKEYIVGDDSLPTKFDLRNVNGNNFVKNQLT